MSLTLSALLTAILLGGAYGVVTVLTKPRWPLSTPAGRSEAERRSFKCRLDDLGLRLSLPVGPYGLSLWFYSRPWQWVCFRFYGGITVGPLHVFFQRWRGKRS